ncbi:POU domain, class 6, transcription factor 1-like [Notothenia coriiceps]|uniref:POU domain, class 6, transcription factor 1-like n=1 Tax=Notothenia coriiceps TaxID=8208 RepID=A0A6I9NQA6_9TELE|nr:PREDICTED: POU domain, class 6, transcription factor 1-like [Notothenia coriiceps]
MDLKSWRQINLLKCQAGKKVDLDVDFIYESGVSSPFDNLICNIYIYPAEYLLLRRFEKLDITPKSAQKLKPVLEKWLAEAEHWNQKGQQNLMEFVGGEPSKKRKRRTSFTPQAIEVLNSYFDKNALPTGQEITEMARELNYDREVVRVWFCNRRQTLKNTSKINVFQVQ